MNAESIAVIFLIISTVIILTIVFGDMVGIQLTDEIIDEKTKREKTLIKCMNNLMLIILSMVVCVSVWIKFDVMVCFAILVPMLARGLEDAFCSTKWIGIVINHTLMILFSIGCVLSIIAFRYEGILGNDAVKAMILIAVAAVPFKACVDMF